MELGEHIQPHEVIEPKTFEYPYKRYPYKRNSFLSNKAQRSVGTFERRVKECPVLKRIMEPNTFYEQNIRPEMKELKKEQELNKALRHPSDKEVE